MALLTLIKEIDSAHGNRIHGHTFKIEFEFQGKITNGMVENIDFHEIEPIIETVLSKIHKTYIDDVIKTRGTVENISIYLIQQLKNIPSLNAISVWEGKDRFVKVYVKELEDEK